MIKKHTNGLDLWKHACDIIPGGNGLLSKRPERYSPNMWPTYFSKAHGVSVTDMDGEHYIDMAQMGLGSSILGYSNEELTDSIQEVIKNGVNCTLNAPEEVWLAEKLLEQNDFGKGVRFARGGGEAMAMAIRIARAASGRSKVAFSGYHGWMDWYLSANLADETSLTEHLLPGLTPSGVPSGLINTAIPFRYNDCDALAQVFNENKDIGVICIEGARYDFANQNFLELIEEYRNEHDLIVVFDEITSGLRLTNGGVYKLYNFIPDIAVYGKALGGGYAISAAVLGERANEAAEHTFLSSTMWTERVGFRAGLTTLNILERERSWVHLEKMGTEIEKGWVKAAAESNFKLTTTDFKPLITFMPQYGELNDAIKTLFTQFMLTRGYLAATSVYLSTAHDQKIVSDYLDNVADAFNYCAEAIETNSIMSKINGNIRSDNFGRLT